MKRSAFDTLRRGLDNALANWHLVVIRVVEIVGLALLSIGLALAILVPILVSAGFRLMDVSTPERFEELMLLLLSKWVLLLWVFLGISVLLLVFVAVHAFVEAGCARVVVDAERIAGPANEGVRSRYRVFSMQRWWTGAKDGWWTVFWIYNFAWGVAGLIMLIPLAPTAAIMWFSRETPAALIGTGCVGLALTVLVMLVVGVVTGMWTTRAIADWAADHTGASAALSGAWSSIKSDVGRHIIIALAVIVLVMAGSSFFASFSYIAAFGSMLNEGAVFQIITIPLRLISTLLSWAFSAFVTNWYFASYGALAVEKKS